MPGEKVQPVHVFQGKETKAVQLAPSQTQALELFLFDVETASIRQSPHSLCIVTIDRRAK